MTLDLHAIGDLPGDDDPVVVHPNDRRPDGIHESSEQPPSIAAELLVKAGPGAAPSVTAALQATSVAIDQYRLLGVLIELAWKGATLEVDLLIPLLESRWWDLQRYALLGLQYTDHIPVSAVDKIADLLHPRFRSVKDTAFWSQMAQSTPFVTANTAFWEASFATWQRDDGSEMTSAAISLLTHVPDCEERTDFDRVASVLLLSDDHRWQILHALKRVREAEPERLTTYHGELLETLAEAIYLADHHLAETCGALAEGAATINDVYEQALADVDQAPTRTWLYQQLAEHGNPTPATIGRMLGEVPFPDEAAVRFTAGVQLALGGGPDVRSLAFDALLEALTSSHRGAAADALALLVPDLDSGLVRLRDAVVRATSGAKDPKWRERLLRSLDAYGPVSRAERDTILEGLDGTDPNLHLRALTNQRDTREHVIEAVASRLAEPECRDAATRVVQAWGGVTIPAIDRVADSYLHRTAGAYDPQRVPNWNFIKRPADEIVKNLRLQVQFVADGAGDSGSADDQALLEDIMGMAPVATLERVTPQHRRANLRRGGDHPWLEAYRQNSREHKRAREAARLAGILAATSPATERAIRDVFTSRFEDALARPWADLEFEETLARNLGADAHFDPSELASTLPIRLAALPRRDLDEPTRQAVLGPWRLEDGSQVVIEESEIGLVARATLIGEQLLSERHTTLLPLFEVYRTGEGAAAEFEGRMFFGSSYESARIRMDREGEGWLVADAGPERTRLLQLVDRPTATKLPGGVTLEILEEGTGIRTRMGYRARVSGRRWNTDTGVGLPFDQVDGVVAIDLAVPVDHYLVSEGLVRALDGLRDGTRARIIVPAALTSEGHGIGYEVEIVGVLDAKGWPAVEPESVVETLEPRDGLIVDIYDRGEAPFTDENSRVKLWLYGTQDDGEIELINKRGVKNFPLSPRGNYKRNQPIGLRIGLRGLGTGARVRIRIPPPWTAWNDHASVSGGQDNTAGGNSASVSGGRENVASDDFSSVSGGRENVASFNYSSVSGGYRNTASASHASVSGGRSNSARAFGSSISGGYYNTADGSSSSISGGVSNVTSAVWSSVSGGEGNTATGEKSSVSGGRANTADGLFASISGGQYNVASGPYSSISGGRENMTSNSSSSVSGGRGNTAYGNYSSVSGGGLNVATGGRSSVSGGLSNEATGGLASVSGGRANDAVGTYASVSGGANNTASGGRASVSGGRFNTAAGGHASVSGGYNDVASGSDDWVAGALFQDN